MIHVVSKEGDFRGHENLYACAVWFFSAKISENIGLHQKYGTHIFMEIIMKKKVFTVSEDTEIILNGKKFLLESGDKIILEDDIDSMPSSTQEDDEFDHDADDYLPQTLEFPTDKNQLPFSEYIVGFVEGAHVKWRFPNGHETFLVTSGSHDLDLELISKTSNFSYQIDNIKEIEHILHLQMTAKIPSDDELIREISSKEFDISNEEDFDPFASI